jgi:hypothetical protein
MFWWTGSLDGFVSAKILPQVQGYILNKVYREGIYVRNGDLCSVATANLSICRHHVEDLRNFARRCYGQTASLPGDDRIGTLRELELNKPTPSSKRQIRSSNRLAFTFVVHVHAVPVMPRGVL